MSDVQLLFVVLAILYAWECLCWLRRGGVAFSSWLGRKWVARHPAALAGNQNGGFVFAAPMPPLGTLFVAHQLPLSFSPDGVLAFVAANVNSGWRPAQSGRFVPWSDVREARARGKKLLINGELLLHVATPGLARYLVSKIKRIAALRPDERVRAIQDLVQASLDVKAIEARRTDWHKQARPICWLANLLVVFSFGIVPALVWTLGFALTWLWLLLGLLGLALTTATWFARAHRGLYPDARDERFTHTLTIALAPTSAMRAHDTLSRPLLETFHPLAVASVLLEARAFNEFARRLLIDLRHPALPLCPNEQPAALAAENFFRQTSLVSTETFLVRQGIEPAALCRPPVLSDESSRAYCPRCETQFTSVDGRCTDCGGLALVAFEKAQLDAPSPGGPARQTFQ
ncbi:MAG TPA: hypothetical protein VFZ59_17495 [Verrucomicrobiae bacterium]|nr:hypothetical protein [Verrucomicrobiae bacterium]